MENNKVPNMQGMQNVQNIRNVINDDVIDLMEIFYVIKKRIFIIICSAVICGCLAGLYTMFMVTPMYSSTASILVLSKEESMTTSYSDLQLGTQLTNDYQVIMKSTTVLEKVIYNLGLEMEPEQLYKCISVDNPTNTRIIDVTVLYEDPILAKAIVDEIAEVSSVYVSEKMDVNKAEVIENGKIAMYQTSPSLKKNLFIGLFAGAVLSAAIFVYTYLIDDTIKTEEDMEKYLGIPALASVPDRKDFINTKKTKNNRRRKNRK